MRIRQIWAHQRIAEFLAVRPGVRQAHVPGVAGYPGHLLAVKQMSGGFGGFRPVATAGNVAAGRVCERARMFALAVSLGSVESLMGQAARMAIASLRATPGQRRRDATALSIGLEDCDELIADLEQALIVPAAASRHADHRHFSSPWSQASWPASRT